MRLYGKEKKKEREKKEGRQKFNTLVPLLMVGRVGTEY